MSVKGTKRTFVFVAIRSAYDPKRTFAHRDSGNCCDARAKPEPTGSRPGRFAQKHFCLCGGLMFDPRVAFAGRRATARQITMERN